MSFLSDCVPEISKVDRTYTKLSNFTPINITYWWFVHISVTARFQWHLIPKHMSKNAFIYFMAGDCV